MREQILGEVNRSTKVLILFIVSLSTSLFAGSPQSKEQGGMTTAQRHAREPMLKQDYGAEF